MSVPYSIHNAIAKQLLIALEQQDYDDFFDYDNELVNYTNEIEYEAA